MDTCRYALPSILVLILAAVLSGYHETYSSGLPGHPDNLQTAASADTIRHEADVGSVFITALPAAASDSSLTYEIIRAPAMSWLVDRSFMWRTRDRDTGVHSIVLRRSSGARTDTLVLSVTLSR